MQNLTFDLANHEYSHPVAPYTDTADLAPSTLAALPHVHPIAEYEAAFNARRRQAIATVAVGELSGRVLLTQPSMSWADGPRSQPRDGRGRFLTRAWLAEAESFSSTDLAWFRHPVNAVQEDK